MSAVSGGSLPGIVAEGRQRSYGNWNLEIRYQDYEKQYSHRFRIEQLSELVEMNVDRVQVDLNC